MYSSIVPTPLVYNEKGYRFHFILSTEITLFILSRNSIDLKVRISSWGQVLILKFFLPFTLAFLKKQRMAKSKRITFYPGYIPGKH